MTSFSTIAIRRICFGFRFVASPGSTRGPAFTQSQISYLYKRSFAASLKSHALSARGVIEAGGYKFQAKVWSAKESELGRPNQWRGAAQSARPKLRTGHAKQTRSESENEAKIVTAYCAAEQYRIAEAAAILKGAGYTLDPMATGLHPQVLHVRSSDHVYELGKRNPGDIFVFPSGTVVAWNIREVTMLNLISVALLPAAENAQTEHFETEDLRYIEDPNSHRSRMRGDRIDIGVKISPDLLADASPSMMTHLPATDEQHAQQHATDLVLAKVAFSSGLARSVKLAALENSFEAYFQSTRTIPDLMSQGSKIPFTRRFVIRKTGELLKLRAQLNLSSELTDSLPDMFWDSKYELGLERYFEQVGRALDVNVRSRVLNQRMDYAQEIVTVLREQLSERHGLTLEWLIIGLIAIEVLFEIHRVMREHWDGLTGGFGKTASSTDLEDG